MLVVHPSAVTEQLDHQDGRQVSEKDEPLGALGSRPQLIRAVSRPNIARTEGKHPENLPWAKWWVSCTRRRPSSWRSTSRSLSCRANRCWCAAAGVVQCVDRHAHYHVLHRGRLSGREREDDGEAEYVSIGSMRIDVASIESHIRDQWSAAGEYCNRLEANDQKSVIKEIAMYAIKLVEGLMNVKAERDENNLPLDHNPPPVMP
uniref:Uncharacterized protein n=1 Tax=Hyaloperonospora arabidopsidis (strain Emoy2) TaxID=559515 RepID=M4C6B8_HYAAE